MNLLCGQMRCALAGQFARQQLRWETKTVTFFCTILYIGRTEYCHIRDAIFQSCPIFRVVQREVRSNPNFSGYLSDNVYAATHSGQFADLSQSLKWEADNAVGKINTS